MNLSVSFSECKMSEQRRRRRYKCEDEEDKETKVTTPLPSSAGKASTATNSGVSHPSASQEKGSGKQAARPFHARLLDEEADNSSAKADTLPLKKRVYFRRNEPNKEETLPHAASKSVHSQEKCRGEEDERKVVNPEGNLFRWGLCLKKRRFQIARVFPSFWGQLLIKKKEINSTMNPPTALQETGSLTQVARPSLDRLHDEKLLDISSAMPAKRSPKMKFCVSGNEKKMEDKLYEHSVGEDENPRNERNEKETLPHAALKSAVDESSIGWISHLKKKSLVRIPQPSSSSPRVPLLSKKLKREVVIPLRSSAREACTTRNSAMNPHATSQENGSSTQIARRSSLDCLPLKMSEQSKRSPRRRRRIYICNDEEDDETPLPSSAGKASTARNSTMMGPPAASQEKDSGREAARLFHARLPDEEAHTSNLPPPENKVDGRSGEGTENHKVDERSGGEDENRRNYEPNGSLTQSQRVLIKQRNEPNESFIQRVLTDVDTEIGFLNSIIDYYATIELYPFHDHIPSHYFITDWLQVDIPEEKLIVLVKMLRKKYLTNMVRKGATVDFAVPSDQIAFNLAHKIWGGGSNEEYWNGLKLRYKWS